MPALYVIRATQKNIHEFFVAEDKEHAVGLAIAAGFIESYHDVNYVADCTDLFLDPARTYGLAIRKINEFFENHEYGVFKWRTQGHDSYYITVRVESVRDVQTVQSN